MLPSYIDCFNAYFGTTGLYAETNVIKGDLKFDCFVCFERKVS